MALQYWKPAYEGSGGGGGGWEEINHVEWDDNNNNNDNTKGKKKPFNKWALISRQCNKLVVM